MVCASSPLPGVLTWLVLEDGGDVTGLRRTRLAGADGHCKKRGGDEERRTNMHVVVLDELKYDEKCQFE